MKKTFALLFMGLLVLVSGLTIVNEESKSEAKIRTNVYTRDGKSFWSSAGESQKEPPAQLKNSEIEAKFKDESYAFSLSLQYADFEKNVVYKDELAEQASKDHLQSASNYLNKLTKNGTDFTSSAWLQNDEEWTMFVKDIARLKYEDFANSEVINDLNIAGALILQAERYYDEPSLRYLYQVISDLNSGIRNESDKFNVTLSFGEEAQFQEIHKYLQSKI